MKILAISDDRQGIVLIEKDIAHAIRHIDDINNSVMVLMGTMAVEISSSEVYNLMEDFQDLNMPPDKRDGVLKEAIALLDNIMTDMKEEGGNQWYTDQIETLIKKFIRNPIEKLEQTPMNDNELIAEFMGLERKTVFGKVIYGEFAVYDYNKRWDWLMPVVEKIEDELGLNTTIENAVVTIEGNLINEKGIDVAYYVKQIPYESQDETKITLVHKSVVEFIKWYNTNSHKR